MLNDLFGETGGSIAQFALALIFVIALIVLVAWGIKRLGGGRFGTSQSGRAELEIVDAIVVDQKRRLVLVRHGKLEHLLLIGGGSDEVVERSMIGGIPIAARAQAARPVASAPAPPAPSAAPAARPPVAWPGPSLPPVSSPSATVPAAPAASMAVAASGAVAAGAGLLATSQKAEPAAAASTAASTAPARSASVPAAQQSEREALEQSLDAALHDSIVESSADVVNAAEQTPIVAPPALPQGMAAPAKIVPSAATLDEQMVISDDDLARELQAAFDQDATDAQPAQEEPRPVTPQPRPQPVPVQIPRRGPAATAVSLVQAPIEPARESAGDQAPGETGRDAPLIDLSDLLEPPAQTQEASSMADLDEEMRRLLGEIAGAPKKS